MKFIATLGGRD